MVEHVALEPCVAVDQVGPGLGARPAQQLQPGQDVGEPVVVVVGSARVEHGDRARDAAHLGQAHAQEDGVLRGAADAVVRGEIEEQRVVLGDHGGVVAQDSAVADAGHDAGVDVRPTVGGELGVVGREPHREGPVEVDARRPPPSRPRRRRRARGRRRQCRPRFGAGRREGRRLVSGLTARVTPSTPALTNGNSGRRALGSLVTGARRRGRRFDRSASVLLDTSRERRHRAQGEAIRALGPRDRTPPRQPGRPPGRRAAGRRLALAHPRRAQRRGRGDGGRTHPDHGPAQAIQRGLDDLRRCARVGGAPVLPALPAPRRPLRRRGSQRRRLLHSCRYAAPGCAHHPDRALPARAGGPRGQPRAQRPEDHGRRLCRQRHRWRGDLRGARPRRAQPPGAQRCHRAAGHQRARHDAGRAGRRRSAGTDQDRRRGVRAPRHAGSAPAPRGVGARAAVRARRALGTLRDHAGAGPRVPG